MQLEKILQSQGFGSRNQCRLLIKQGAVSIAGQKCLDYKAIFNTEKLEFSVLDQCYQFRKQVYIALYKPLGYECSHTPQHHASVFSLLPHLLINRNIQCVGRLDADTTGLQLLSDDGTYIHALTHPRKHVAKQYLVTTSSEITTQQIQQLLAGVLLHGEKIPILADSCEQVTTHSLRLTIHQGIYHQVKRMLAAVGNHVTALHRETIGQLQLANLNQIVQAGQWCYLDEAEILHSKTSQLV